MKQTVQRFTALYARAIAPILMLLLLAGGMFLPAGDAWGAQGHAVATKLVEWKLVRNEKVKDIAQPGYYSLFVRMNHTNSTNSLVVKTIHNKRGSFTITAGSSKITVPLKSVKVNRVSLDPGQSIKLHYTLPITDYGVLSPKLVNIDLKNRKKAIKYTYSVYSKLEKL